LTTITNKHRLSLVINRQRNVQQKNKNNRKWLTFTPQGLDNLTTCWYTATKSPSYSAKGQTTGRKLSMKSSYNYLQRVHDCRPY